MSTLGSIIYLIIAAFFYMLPTIIGRHRGVANLGSVAVINVFLGWTFIGWVAALAMAFRSVQKGDVK